jgi:predicted acylesterase/phospholipase RssA
VVATKVLDSMVGYCWVHSKNPLCIHHSQNRRPRAPSRPLDSARLDAARTATGGYDIILSSGFLAFAAHCGFLKAVEDVGLPVAGVMGTSAGALVGSFFAAGYSADEIAEEFSRVPPIERICPSREPWTGLLSYDPAILTLRKLLPPSFEDLELEFGVGVVGGEGAHELVQKGPLAEAVAASAAVPFLFSPVAIPGSRQNPYKDGGVACRVGLELWRSRHNGLNSHRSSVVHLIGRSSPFSGNDAVAEQTGPTQVEVRVVHSPKSGASLWDLSGFEEQYVHARERAMPLLKSLMLDKDLDGVEVGRLQKENVIVNP